MKIRHERLHVGGAEADVLVVEGTRDDALGFLRSATFGSPVLVLFSEEGKGGILAPPLPRQREAGNGLSLTEILRVLRRHPDQYRDALTAYVQKNPGGGPGDFSEQHFGTRVKARGEGAAAFNAIYIRMRTIRTKLGLPTSIHGIPGGRRMELDAVSDRTAKGEGDTAHGSRAPKPREVQKFIRELVTSDRTVSTRDLQHRFFGDDFTPGRSPEDHLRNKRLVDYAAYARRAIAKELSGRWESEGPRGGPNITWRFVRGERGS